MAQGRGNQPGVRRNSTVKPAWPAAVLENFYECPSGARRVPEIFAYTDRISYSPGERVRFHVSTTAPRYDLEIIRDGLKPTVVYRRSGLKGRYQPTPEDCSVNGCGWKVAHSFALPPRLVSGG